VSRAGWIVVWCTCALIGAVALRVLIGPTGMSVPGDADTWLLRVDRALSGVVVGAALALGGVFLQSLLRNPLASPDLIGPASGAGFSVMLSIYLTGAAGLSATGFASMSLNTTAALIGSLGAIALVYTFSQRRGFIDPVQLVLVGVVISIMFGAATMFLMYLMPDRGLMSRWTIGALSDDVPRMAIILGLVVVLVGIVAGGRCAGYLDAAALLDDEAVGVGVPVRALRIGLFLGAGVLTAGAVVLAGPVGFVGLISPHVVRRLAGPGHAAVVPGSAACGATMVVLADAATRAIDLGSGRMPLGVITALLGGVGFIWIARSSGGPRGSM
jgi:iron complex transport system permease protein